MVNSNSSRNIPDDQGQQVTAPEPLVSNVPSPLAITVGTAGSRLQRILAQLCRS